ncbi:transmembrane reductase CYB561D2 [Cotesia typhae]|uniref:transmembrane reductase CYB561D2 n=1 Tax=Cotesia typhae TaxID=2053667 RepID=UPI003D69E327
METDKSGSVDKKSDSLTMINSVMTIITHALLVIPAAYIVISYFVHYDFFSWHPICMALGVGLLLMEGIFAISGESNLTTRVKRAQRVTIHWILVTSGLTLMFIGLIIAVVNKNRLNKFHFVTTHAQLGLSAIVISFVLALVGTVALNSRWVYPHVRPVVIKVAHAFGGIAMSVIFVATIINGTYKHSFPGGYVGRDIIFGCYFFGMLLLLFKPIVGAISRSRVILKPSQPSS